MITGRAASGGDGESRDGSGVVSAALGLPGYCGRISHGRNAAESDGQIVEGHCVIVARIVNVEPAQEKFLAGEHDHARQDNIRENMAIGGGVAIQRGGGRAHGRAIKVERGKWSPNGRGRSVGVSDG